jgi:hypothetical protein
MPKSLPYGLKAQRLKNAEIPSTAELLAVSPDDSSVYQFPHWREHTEEIVQMYIHFLRRFVRDRKYLIRVATVPDRGAVKVVGFSMWSRKESKEGKIGEETARSVDMWSPSLGDCTHLAFFFFGKHDETDEIRHQ